MARKKRIYTVKSVTATIDGNVLVIEAQGSVRTGGWKEPELVETASSQDEKVFDFVATPPSGMATQALGRIAVQYRSGPLRPPFPRTVRVKAETNEQAAKVG